MYKQTQHGIDKPSTLDSNLFTNNARDVLPKVYESRKIAALPKKCWCLNDMSLVHVLAWRRRSPFAA